MACQTAGARPNILLIIVHDLGQYLSCYGAPVETPHLQALAEEGVVFDYHFCTAAQCSPSRGSLLTGRMPHNNGLIGLAHLGWQLGAQEVTLPMYLNAAGYDTYLLGMQHEHPEPRRLGYQHIEIKHKAREAAPLVIDFLQYAAAHPPARPFFINTGWFEPHRPYEAEGYEKDNPEKVTPLPWLPDRPGIRQDIAGLNGLVREVDYWLGQIRQTLYETGLAEHTLLIFTTDHGLAMPRAKGTCYDPGLKIAFLAHWPGYFEGGRRYVEMTSNMDVLPTLLELAGVPIPPQIEGKSFLPVLEGQPYLPHEFLFAEMTWHDKYNPMRAIRTPRYKYIRNFGDRPLVYLPLDIWQGAAGREMREEYYRERRPTHELYDLEKDPWEQKNVFEDPAYAEIGAQLRQRVEQYMIQSNDPLLYGDIPPTTEQAARIAEWRADN